MAVNCERIRSWIVTGILAVRERMREMGSRNKKQEDQDLFFDMAKAWTNIALVEGDVAKLAAQELPKRAPQLAASASISLARMTLKVALNP